MKQLEDVETFDPGDANILCKEGVSLQFYEKAKSWLHKKKDRRLFVIENCPERLARLRQGDLAPQMIQDPRVKIFPVETLFDQEFALKKIVWLSVFKKCKVVSPNLEPLIAAKLFASQLLASDSIDFGTGVLKHLIRNFQKPMKRLSALQGTMKRVPAIVIGAGPSLEQTGPFLEAWQDKALLITAGNAIHSLKVKPSLAVALDPHEPLRKASFSKVPFCLQGRTHPGTRAHTTGDVLYFPDSHYAFEPHLTQSMPFNTGWTVGNGAVAVALQLGCNPIILVGMDYCYRGRQKYAGRKETGDMPLVPALDAKGQEVLTQTDWLMSIHWMEEIARENPEITFINATAEGMQMKEPVQTRPLPPPPQEGGVFAKWEKALQNAPVVELTKDQLKQWKESLESCDEEVRKLLLEPLWSVWGPFFERELMTDTYPISLDEKLAMQKDLFFKRVIEEHKAVLQDG